MEEKHYYVIKVLSQSGEWYNNAFVENSFDAIKVALFYKNQLGYVVQLWYQKLNVSFLLDNVREF